MSFVLGSESRYNLDGSVISDEGEMEFEDGICFFIEIQCIFGNSGMRSSLIIIQANHLQEPRFDNLTKTPNNSANHKKIIKIEIIRFIENI